MIVKIKNKNYKLNMKVLVRNMILAVSTIAVAVFAFAKEPEEKKQQQMPLQQNSISIDGYIEMDYAQCISYLITKVKGAGYEPSDMNFGGTTLENHLFNLNKAAKSEGINPIVALAQQIIETGYFRYENSSVKPEYHNYAGMGATNENPEPNQFKDDYTGNLAQIQHLLAYATTRDVKNELVDPRFKYVTERGKDSSVNVLVQRWAVGNENYGQQITEKYNEILSHNTNMELVNKYTNNK